MTYDETLKYLYSQLPMYQRVGKAAYKADLKTTLQLDEYFNHPHKKYKTIHIAGTNGKGSVAHSIASVLQEAGYKTGLYTSPHYLDFRERIKINGENIDKNFVIDFVDKHSAVFSQFKPSFFEITVAMAFEYFAAQNIDIAVIETGMGGRLDSTNIVTPILSIITNIGYDHTQFLGEKLTQIAAEKAGIIKKDVPVVIGETKPELKAVFSKFAQKVDAPIFFASHNYFVKNFSYNIENQLVFNIEKHGKQIFNGLEFDLSGHYQKMNIPTILQSLEILQNLLKITDENIYAGLKNIVHNTCIMGRWQKLSTNPLVIADAGHNYDGILQVTQQLKTINYNKLHFIIGTVNDKDLSKILRLLPQEAQYYFTKANIPRSMQPVDLQARAISFGLSGDIYANVANAIEKAVENAGKSDLIFIGGSTFVVAEAISFYQNIKIS